MQAQMQSAMMACFHSVQGKLQRQLGFFDLLGFDFMVDKDLQVRGSKLTLCTHTDKG